MTAHSYTAAAVIENGRLHLMDRPDLARAVSKMPDGPAQVEVKPMKRSRTLAQNAFWWSTPVRLLAEHCGYTDNQMHYALLGECFGYTHGPTGHPVPVKPSSSDLSVEEFKQLIDWVLVWAPTELGVVIPEPGEFGGDHAAA